MNKPKIKQSHVANTKLGSGDYYGSAIKQKTGRMRSVFGYNEVPPKKLKTPPRSVV
jgi:hypothetical protein